MKKFSFSLQKLLDYKEQVFNSERAVLADMNAVLHRMEQELDNLLAEQRDRAAEYNRKIAEGTTPMEIVIYNNYRQMLDNSIVQKHHQIKMQQNAIAKQTDKVREAKVEISTMEKLKEKKLEEYRYLSNKAEEQFIEEFVSNAKATAQYT